MALVSIAAFMAAKGYTCAEDTLESGNGFAAVFADPPHLESAVDRLGQHYEITANAYKPYPAGIVNHAPIDACMQLAAEPGVNEVIVLPGSDGISEEPRVRTAPVPQSDARARWTLPWRARTMSVPFDNC